MTSLHSYFTACSCLQWFTTTQACFSVTIRPLILQLINMFLLVLLCLVQLFLSLTRILFSCPCLHQSTTVKLCTIFNYNYPSFYNSCPYLRQLTTLKTCVIQLHFSYPILQLINMSTCQYTLRQNINLD